MPRIVTMMRVEDLDAWLERVPSRGEVYRLLTEHPVDYGTTDEGEIVLSFEVDDLEVFFRAIRSQAFMEALAVDGIRRETAKIHVLDRKFDPN